MDMIVHRFSPLLLEARSVNSFLPIVAMLGNKLCLNVIMFQLTIALHGLGALNLYLTRKALLLITRHILPSPSSHSSALNDHDKVSKQTNLCGFRIIHDSASHVRCRHATSGNRHRMVTSFQGKPSC